MKPSLTFLRRKPAAPPPTPSTATEPAESSRHSLQSLIFFALRHRDRIDPAGVVPALLSVYRSARDEGHRILALTALHALGDAGAMQALGDHVRHEASPRLRDLTLAVLQDYYATPAY